MIFLLFFDFGLGFVPCPLFIRVIELWVETGGSEVLR